MLCKYCKKDVPDESIYCLYCGERLARRKRESKSARYPKFRVLSDGSLLGQVMIAGERETVRAATEAEYRARIDALRAGLLERKAHPDRRPLKDLLKAYVDSRDAVLSPSTVRGYDTVMKNRFLAWQQTPVCEIDWQRMVNDEAKLCAPKTLKNAWALVAAALRSAGLDAPKVTLPQIPESDEDFLDYEQIKVFLTAIRGDSCELAALLLLHSLRMSELLKLTADDVRDGVIRVRGAVVVGRNNVLVEKAANKNRSSHREIPIMIPRLTELLPKDGTAEGKLVTLFSTTIGRHVVNACRSVGLPPCSPHDLRRSFASLAYHLKWSERAIQAVGGWSGLQTVHKIYVKLSKKDVTADVQNMQNYYQITTTTEKPAPQATETPNA